ncbi:hypothetical protein M405DRAFT_830642, partial [Rhizopogon salebrosus TDB-379]
MYRRASSLPSSVPLHPHPLSPSGHQGACYTTAAVSAPAGRSLWLRKSTPLQESAPVL